MEKTFGLDPAHSSGTTSHHENVAASLQCVTEEIVIHLLNELYKKYPSDNLCLAGGVAMNSVANGKIYRQTPFKNVFIPAGAADNGGSFGAAFYVWNNLLKKPRQFVMEHAFWGPEFAETEIKSSIDRYSNELVCRLYEEGELIAKTLSALCDGKIVGWFQGRMELGARALGNRSLLADPRRTDVRDIINLKIKFREKFRPFAPSILVERVADFFEDNVPSPFMEKVVPIRQEKRFIIPAVTHVDGSGRLQTVDSRSNSLYYKLIKGFEKKTGIPLVLNTSLNENEPIVCTPEEALQCFLRTKMDVMALGNYYVERA
jgi:carbamoyltransferase